MPRGNPEYVVYLYDGSTVIEVHQFTCEPTESQSHYRALSSMTWFTERELKNIYGDDNGKPGKPQRFHLGTFDRKKHVDEREELYRLECENLKRPYEPLLPDVPVFVHTSLWDMYKAVGYDYKQKKWVRQ